MLVVDDDCFMLSKVMVDIEATHVFYVGLSREDPQTVKGSDLAAWIKSNVGATSAIDKINGEMIKARDAIF